MSSIRIYLLVLISVAWGQSFGGIDGQTVSEFGAFQTFTQIGSARDGLDIPRGVEFNPDHPNEVWVVNLGFEGTVTFLNAGTSNQTSDKRQDYYHNHFASKVSSIAFGSNHSFATCQEGYGDAGFMGPTLWPSDLNIYAEVNQGNNALLGSHIDMLHESPNCMGIAHDRDNSYWVFDGYHGQLVYYDFNKPHLPGEDNHSDGHVRRYPEAKVTRVAGIASDMVLDSSTGWLYIADTGGSRIQRVLTTSGTFYKRLTDNSEPLAEYSEYRGEKIETFVSVGLTRPSGIAIHDGKLFVSDNANGEIVSYDLQTGNALDRVDTPASSIMGITISPDGKIWYVDADANSLTRMDPN